MGTTLTYEVRLIDVLGVASEPATVQVDSPDFEAGRPPSGQIAKSGRGFITLSWAAPANARTSGLVVERSQLADGPYERLTPEGLAPNSMHFDDRQVLAGASYYYRVRAVTPSGDLGPAGDPIRAQALAAAALSAPAGLAAEAGISQIALHWSPVPGLSLAGYIIERRGDASTTRWARLNSRLLPEPHYLDVVGPSQGGGFDYRVTAVAADEGRSPPSAVLHVALVDSGTPSAPHVLSVSGADGHVQIHFAPAEPIAKTVQVALLRSESAQEDGLVVGAPVAAGAGVIGDDWVRGGEVNWYRLVAFDKNGQRSPTTDAYQIRVAGCESADAQGARRELRRRTCAARDVEVRRPSAAHPRARRGRERGRPLEESRRPVGWHIGARSKPAGASRQLSDRLRRRERRRGCCIGGRGGALMPPASFRPLTKKSVYNVS